MSDCVKTLFIGGFMDGERVPKRFERFTKMARRVDCTEMYTIENYREELIACEGVMFRIMIVESMSMLDAMKQLVDGYSGPRLDKIYGLVARIKKVDGDFSTFLNECIALTEYLAPNPELKTHDYVRLKILIAIAVDWISRHGRSDDGCHDAASSHRATPTHGQSVSGYPEQVPAVRGLEVRRIAESMTQEIKDEICSEILEIMAEWHRQMDSKGYVSTPGGFEHMGDVWRKFLNWEERLKVPELRETKP